MPCATIPLALSPTVSGNLLNYIAFFVPATLFALIGHAGGHIFGLIWLLAGLLVGGFCYGVVEGFRDDRGWTGEDRPIGPLAAIMACICGFSLGMHTGGIIAGIFGAASPGAIVGGVAGGLFGGWLVLLWGGPQAIIIALVTVAGMLGGGAAVALVLGADYAGGFLAMAGPVVGYFAGRIAGTRFLLPLLGRIMAGGPEWAYSHWRRGELFWDTGPVGRSKGSRRREQSQSQHQGGYRGQRGRREQRRQGEQRESSGQQRQREQRRQREQSRRRQGSRRRGQADSSLVDAYRTLGVSPSATDAEVKTAYRRLMRRYHPDKFASKELPEEMMRVAHERTQKIQAAWEAIKTARQI